MPISRVDLPREPKQPRLKPSAAAVLRRHAQDRETRRLIADKLGQDLPTEDAVLAYRQWVLGRTPALPDHLSLEDETIIEALPGFERLKFKRADEKSQKKVLEDQRHQRQLKALKYRKLLYVIWTMLLCRDVGRPLVQVGLPRIPTDHPLIRRLRQSSRRKLEQVRQAHEIMYQVRRFGYGPEVPYFASARFIANELVRGISKSAVARYNRILLNVGVIEYAVDERTGEVQTLHGFQLLRPGRPTPHEERRVPVVLQSKPKPSARPLPMNQPKQADPVKHGRITWRAVQGGKAVEYLEIYDNGVLLQRFIDGKLNWSRSQK